MTDAAKVSHRVLRLFATPVIVDELGDSDLNIELEKIIVARMKSDPGVRLSNLGGWQSKHDLPTWTGKTGERIIKHAAALATANTTATPGSAFRWSIDAWANVSGSGAANRSHIHGGSFWSAVYYVRVGSGEGGELILHDPRMPALRMHAPNLRFNDGGPEVIVPIKPKTGLMILFPAWLSHSVQPWEGESRISIAMNIRAGSPAPRRAAAVSKSDPAMN